MILSARYKKDIKIDNMNTIKYVTGQNKRVRYVPGQYFSSLFRIREMEFCSENERYPIPIRIKDEILIPNDEQRLVEYIELLDDYRYDCGMDDALCYIVQEIPMYWPIRNGDYIQERIYCYGRLVGGQYSKKWVNRGEYDDGTHKWFACEGEDEDVAEKFAKLHSCIRGEVVYVVKDDSLTLGIVIDDSGNGNYDMWLWNENQECSREQVSTSRVLYGYYMLPMCRNETENMVIEKLKANLEVIA